MLKTDDRKHLPESTLMSSLGKPWFSLIVLLTVFAISAPRVGHAAASAVAAVQQNTDTVPPPMEAVLGGEVKCINGKAKLYDCRSIDLLSFLPATAIGGNFAAPLGKLAVIINDMWGWTDPSSGREFAMVGRVDGTAFIEVTDPVHPKYLGNLPLHEGAHWTFWRDIKVYKNHAFIVSDVRKHGMQVFDLKQLLDVKHAPVALQETAHYDRIGNAHNIAIDTATGFAYTTSGGEDCGNRIQFIDIHDPRHPAFAGCSPSTGAHDIQCVLYRGPDQRYRNWEICVDAVGSQVNIVDVTDKKEPKTIATATYPNVGYAHQGWFTDDQHYFFLDDESDEGNGRMTRTIVFDLNSLTDPVVAKEFFGTTPAIDHNLYVRGRYVYEANYKAGLRVLDISNPIAPKEVGYFDTTPNAENDAQYGGAWSDYPFFKNGVVGISSISEGFFLVRFKPAASGGDRAVGGSGGGARGGGKTSSIPWWLGQQ